MRQSIVSLEILISFNAIRAQNETVLNWGCEERPLAEVSLFDLGKYYAAADEVSKSLEDEQETETESETSDSMEEEIDLMNHFYLEQSFNVFFTSLKKESTYIQQVLHEAYQEIFSPPPESSQSVA